MLRIQDFFVRNHELCFEFKTFSFEIMEKAIWNAIYSKIAPPGVKGSAESIRRTPRDPPPPHPTPTPQASRVEIGCLGTCVARSYRRYLNRR